MNLDYARANVSNMIISNLKFETKRSTLNIFKFIWIYKQTQLFCSDKCRYGRVTLYCCKVTKHCSKQTLVYKQTKLVCSDQCRYGRVTLFCCKTKETLFQVDMNELADKTTLLWSRYDRVKLFCFVMRFEKKPF